MAYFDTLFGRRSNSKRRKRSSSRKRKMHPSLKKNAKKMKELGKRYRAGEFGNMSWRSVCKKHLGGNKRKSRKRRNKHRSRK